jgi:sec-independent protein translocase protein TatA
MPNIGPMELVIVLVIALLVLGPKRLPEAGRSLGRGLREFKESVRGGDLEAHAELTQTADVPAAER